jgi:hypothetical protein
MIRVTKPGRFSFVKVDAVKPAKVQVFRTLKWTFTRCLCEMQKPVESVLTEKTWNPDFLKENPFRMFWIWRLMKPFLSEMIPDESGAKKR